MLDRTTFNKTGYPYLRYVKDGKKDFALVYTLGVGNGTQHANEGNEFSFDLRMVIDVQKSVRMAVKKLSDDN